MSKLQVHELARGLGQTEQRSDRKDKYNRGKEHIAKLDTPKTEEKVVTAKSEGDKTETPKKKKNIIRVFHAQNASDGGKTRKKPVKAEGERTGSPRNAEGRNSDSSRTAVTDQEEIIMTVQVPATEDRTEQNRQGRRQGEGRSQGERFGQGRNQGEGNRQGRRPGREDPREKPPGRTFRTREDPRAMVRAVRAEDSRAMEIVREDRFGQGRPQGDGNRQGGRPQGMARVVRTETEVKDVTDTSATVRYVRDSARIQERMTIWYLHRN